MHDAVREIRADVRDIKCTQTTHGERLAAVEARVSDHVNRSRPNVPCPSGYIALAKRNNIRNPDRIQVGQKIKY